jgi:hypothetical protein
VLAEGDAKASDTDGERSFGCHHPIGPLAWADHIGFEVLLATTQTLHDEPGYAMRQAFEHLASDWIEFGLKAWTRRATVPSSSRFSSPTAAAAGLLRGSSPTMPVRRCFEREAAQSGARAELEGAVERGGLVGAFVHVVLYFAHPAGHVDERGFPAMKEVGAMIPSRARPSFPRVKEVMRCQALTLQLDRQRAVVALPRLVPDDEGRWRLLDGLRRLLSFRPTLSGQQWRRLSQVQTQLAAQGARRFRRERVVAEE